MVLLQDHFCLWEPGADRVLNLAVPPKVSKLSTGLIKSGASPQALLEAVCMWGLHTPSLRSVAPVRCKLLVPSYNAAEVGSGCAASVCVCAQQVSVYVRSK